MSERPAFPRQRLTLEYSLRLEAIWTAICCDQTGTQLNILHRILTTVCSVKSGLLSRLRFRLRLNLFCPVSGRIDQVTLTIALCRPTCKSDYIRQT